MYKNLFASLALSILLVGCAKESTVYSVSIDSPERETELYRASISVIEGRVRAAAAHLELEDIVEDVDIDRRKNTITLTIENGTEELEEKVQGGLTSPFSFEFYVQADTDIPVEEADIIVGETQGFNKTSLSTEHVDWVFVDKDGAAIIEFTEEGKAAKKQVFSELEGEFIGIFVRGKPTYKFLVEEKDIQEDTLLVKTSNAQLSQVFANDVNVGLHVSFTPVQ